MCKDTPKVILIEECKVDVSEAAQYGSIVYMFSRDHPRSSIWDETFKQHILKAMDRLEYDPKRDYFVVAGYMVPLAIAIATLVRRYNEIRVLLFSAINRKYVPQTIGDRVDADDLSRDIREDCRDAPRGILEVESTSRDVSETRQHR